MRKLITIFFLTTPFSASAGFVHPMDFNGSDSQKQEVIQYIQEKVKSDYCGKVDMCNATTLRMMEQQNLQAFKRATKAQNRQIMDRVIHDYCNNALDMCDYNTILMMYEQNEQAIKQELSW
ncbi:hypothetical protein P3697_01545 [Vibrio parahaemolyticus]|nr:hypothetical protein [Vibrio parahaemolyticus]MDF5070815.1 hypothetical protein [Vibrio parahaemolyticus]MDF5300682.1 hypothetical protein [Vibrio parahaemolyticus]